MDLHTRRRVPLVVAALVGAVALSASVWLVSPSESARSQIRSGGYAIDVVEVGYAKDEVTGQVDPTRARVEYRVSWATSDFPGLRQCVWQVRDSAGRIVGTVHGTLEALEPEYGGSFVQYVPVRGEPATAAVGCDSSRLDNPERRLRPTNPRLKEGSDVPGARYSIGFDVVWTSDRGKATMQSCVIRVYDGNGELLSTEERSLGIDEGTRHVSLPVFAEETEAEPASADVTCSPLGG